jgi:hypothetical protein
MVSNTTELRIHECEFAKIEATASIGRMCKADDWQKYANFKGGRKYWRILFDLSIFGRNNYSMKIWFGYAFRVFDGVQNLMYWCQQS